MAVRQVPQSYVIRCAACGGVGLWAAFDLSQKYLKTTARDAFKDAQEWEGDFIASFENDPVTIGDNVCRCKEAK